MPVAYHKRWTKPKSGLLSAKAASFSCKFGGGFVWGSFGNQP